MTPLELSEMPFPACCEHCDAVTYMHISPQDCLEICEYKLEMALHRLPEGEPDEEIP